MLMASPGYIYPCLLLVSRVWYIFLPPIGWKILQMVRQCQGKLTNKKPLAVNEAPVLRRSIMRHLFHANQYLSWVNYTQLGLLGGSSGINKKTSRGAYSSFDLPHTFQQKTNLSHETTALIPYTHMTILITIYDYLMSYKSYIVIYLMTIKLIYPKY